MTGPWISLLCLMCLFGCTDHKVAVSIPHSNPENYLFNCTDKNKYSVFIKKISEENMQERLIKKNDKFKEKIVISSQLQGFTMLFENKTNNDKTIRMKIRNMDNFNRSNIILGKRYSFEGTSEGKYSDHWLVNLEFQKDKKNEGIVIVNEEGSITDRVSDVHKKYKVIRKVDLKTGFDTYFEYLSDDERTICEIDKN